MTFFKGNCFILVFKWLLQVIYIVIWTWERKITKCEIFLSFCHIGRDRIYFSVHPRSSHVSKHLGNDLTRKTCPVTLSVIFRSTQFDCQVQDSNLACSDWQTGFVHIFTGSKNLRLGERKSLSQFFRLNMNRVDMSS